MSNQDAEKFAYLMGLYQSVSNAIRQVELTISFSETNLLFLAMMPQTEEAICLVKANEECINRCKDYLKVLTEKN